MYSTTPRDLIRRAFLLAGILDEASSPTADQESDAFAVLNSYLDYWGVLPNTMRTELRTSMTFTANDDDITVGSGGDVNIVRPQSVAGLSYVSPSSSPEVEVFLSQQTEDVYRQNLVKGLTSGLPTQFYFDATDPLATIIVWPVQTQTLSGYLYTPLAVTQFSSLSTTHSLVPGLERALRYNLCVDLAPEYGRQLDPQIHLTARESLQDYKAQNYAMTDLGIDPAWWPRTAGVYNILTDV